MRAIANRVVGTGLLALAAGCGSVGYYAQAVQGHFALVSAARPLEQWLADPSTPQALRERLERAQRLRAFAVRELALPDNASYTRYADLDRDYAVWNVFAAAEFSVEARRECFLFAGCVSYRGFFAQHDARLHAARLQLEGYDVFVGGVPAYSTLGWFDDPLLSTFIGYPETELARLLFHELAHQVAYAKDDTTFNESFAVAVEEEGVRRWLEAAGRGDELAAFRRAQQRRTEFVALIEDARARLARLYAQPLTPQAMREAKRAEYERLVERYAALKAAWGGFAGYDRLFAEPPNNALLVSISTYTQLVPAFQRLLENAQGDLRAFYARVRALAAEPREARRAALEALLAR